MVRRHTTARPRTDAGRAIYQFALNLTRVTNLDQAAQWGTQLHEYGTIYRDWMNQKTFTTDPATQQRTWSWTHERTRKAYNSLNHLWRNNLLFVYLDPPDGVLDAGRIKSTTNSLEGGINAQLKLLARTHRGRSGEHQRRMLEWWLYLKTELLKPTQLWILLIRFPAQQGQIFLGYIPGVGPGPMDRKCSRLR